MTLYRDGYPLAAISFFRQAFSSFSEKEVEGCPSMPYRCYVILFIGPSLSLKQVDGLNAPAGSICLKTSYLNSILFVVTGC